MFGAFYESLQKKNVLPRPIKILPKILCSNRPHLLISSLSPPSPTPPRLHEPL